MFYTDLMFALLLAMGISLFLPATFGWRHPHKKGLWDNMVFLFLLIFFTSWTGGVWLPRFGPVLFGGHWFPFLFTAFFVVILLFTLAPPDPSQSRIQVEEKNCQEKMDGGSSGFYFLILLAGLFAGIIVHYFG